MVKILEDEACPCGSGRLYQDCHIALRMPATSPPATEKINCIVIPEPFPNSRQVSKRVGSNKGPFWIGQNNAPSYHCGKCETTLVTGMPFYFIKDAVFCCPECSSYNEIPLQPAIPLSDRPLPVTNRNSPCPCGSGRKYKHCHGVVTLANDAQSPPKLKVSVSER